MIQDFETYIAEGRMGRLVDAARNGEVRKEDQRQLFTYDEIIAYFKKTYETTNGRLITYNVNSLNIYLDFTELNYMTLNFRKRVTEPDIKDDRTFLYVGMDKGLFSAPHNKSFANTRNYMYNIVGIDEKIYDITHYNFTAVEHSYCEISRKDGKNIIPDDFFKNIYDKLISAPENKKCIVRKK